MAAQSKILETFFTAPFKGIDVNAIIAQAVEHNDDRIIELNTAQLDRGLDMRGKSLGKYKNFKYKNRYQPVDLKLTNDYRRKKTVAVKKNEAEMFSQDQKAPKLEKKYGKDIEGIPSKDYDRLGDILKPSVQENFQRQLVTNGFLKK